MMRDIADVTQTSNTKVPPPLSFRFLIRNQLNKILYVHQNHVICLIYLIIQRLAFFDLFMLTMAGAIYSVLFQCLCSGDTVQRAMQTLCKTF